MVLVALKTVFREPTYLLVALCVFLLTTTTTLLWDHWALLTEFTNMAGPQSGLLLLFTILFGAPTSMGWFAVSIIILTDVLLSLVLTMVWYVWRHQRIHSWRITAATSSGTIAALLGLGCVACGPLLLASILAIFGAAGILTVLPFHGAELSLVALAMLLYALFAISKVITAPAVCQVDAPPTTP